MTKVSKAQLKAQDKYDKENTVQFKMKLNRKIDEDIIKQLNEQTNKQGYIKKLIRDDIKKAAE